TRQVVGARVHRVRGFAEIETDVLRVAVAGRRDEHHALECGRVDRVAHGVRRRGSGAGGGRRIQDAHVHPFGLPVQRPLDCGGHTGVGPGTFVVENLERHDLDVRGDTRYANAVVALRGNDAGDVTAVPVVVLRHAAHVFTVDVLGALEAVGADRAAAGTGG